MQASTSTVLGVAAVLQSPASPVASPRWQAHLGHRCVSRLQLLLHSCRLLLRSGSLQVSQLLLLPAGSVGSAHGGTGVHAGRESERCGVWRACRAGDRAGARQFGRLARRRHWSACIAHLAWRSAASVLNSVCCSSTAQPPARAWPALASPPLLLPPASAWWRGAWGEAAAPPLAFSRARAASACSARSASSTAWRCWPSRCCSQACSHNKRPGAPAVATSSGAGQQPRPGCSLPVAGQHPAPPGCLLPLRTAKHGQAERTALKAWRALPPPHHQPAEGIAAEPHLRSLQRRRLVGSAHEHWLVGCAGDGAARQAAQRAAVLCLGRAGGGSICGQHAAVIQQRERGGWASMNECHRGTCVPAASARLCSLDRALWPHTGHAGSVATHGACCATPTGRVQGLEHAWIDTEYEALFIGRLQLPHRLLQVRPVPLRLHQPPLSKRELGCRSRARRHSQGQQAGRCRRWCRCRSGM